MIFKAIASNAADLKTLRDILKSKYRTLKNAAEKMNVNVYTLSRVVNGSGDCDLQTAVRILVGCGFIKAGKYKMPRIDLETFFLLNTIIKIDLKKGTTEFLRNGRKITEKHK